VSDSVQGDSLKCNEKAAAATNVNIDAIAAEQAEKHNHSGNDAGRRPSKCSKASRGGSGAYNPSDDKELHRKLVSRGIAAKLTVLAATEAQNRAEYRRNERVPSVSLSCGVLQRYCRNVLRFTAESRAACRRTSDRSRV
jgi:hypothetical protein